MDPAKLRRYSHIDIERRAAAVLAEAFPSAISVPIDIDLLAQRHELIDHIIPTLFLEEKFDVAAIAVSKPDGHFDILIDDGNYNYQPFRANFSIAHEFGHIVLHSNICRKCQNLEEAVKMQMALKYDYRFVERAANRFASAVLMPDPKMRQDVSELYQNLAPKTKYGEDLLFHQLCSFLSRKYCVTTKPVEIRLKELKLQEQIHAALKAKSPYLLPTD